MSDDQWDVVLSIMLYARIARLALACSGRWLHETEVSVAQCDIPKRVTARVLRAVPLRDVTKI
jgi:hypothetical protein